MDSLVAEITRHLPYAPNRQQELVLGALARFCAPTADPMAVFMLCGYAGTGKTSLVGALVKALKTRKINCELLAPTGRAAKVFSAYAGQKASTIHRKIYKHASLGDGVFSRATVENTHHDTLFIVDEASMIAGEQAGEENLLEDLIQFVYTGENCRLLLLGDTAQLPPVGSAISPAMDADKLRAYGLKVTRAVLTDIARQSAFSGILCNATALRRAMSAHGDDVPPVPKLITEGYNDVAVVSPEDLPEIIDSAYRTDGMDETIVITRSNRSSVLFNRAIRAEVLYREEELTRGELLTVARNNYHWNCGVKGLDFVANGDILRVEHVYGIETAYGFRFADVRLAIPDTEVEFDAKILLETLYTESAHLPQDRQNMLYYGIMEDNDLWGDLPYDIRAKRLQSNPHWCALHVKYAYAVTCHKAQGGQWRNVLVDLSYIPDDALGTEFYRWLYTAVTRARNRLYLISPPQAMQSQPTNE